MDRRDFLRSALAIGGTSALSTVTGLFGVPEAGAVAENPVSVRDRRNRQHAWDRWERYLPEHEQTVPPAYHLLLLTDYEHDGEPTARDRQRLESALRRVEEAYEWSHEGVMFTVGYSLSYFRRFDEPLPAGIDPAVEPTTKPAFIDGQTVIDAEGVTLPREDPVADDYDVCIHLASDHVQHLLSVEEALWGNRQQLNGVEFDTDLEGLLGKPTEYPDRRVGFVGHDALESMGGEEADDGTYPAAIPEDADLSMGFNDQYRNSIPRETDATLLEDQRLVSPKPPGVFAQGSIQHVSKLDIDLTESDGDRSVGWYDDHDRAARRERMFSPEHDDENTGAVGENLGNSSAPGDAPLRDLDAESDVARRTEEHAETEGTVGHAQKVARARFDLQNRLTEEGQTRLSGGSEPLPGDERENTVDTPKTDPADTLPGHNGTQETKQVLLRRDVDTVDADNPGNHFIGLMRFAPYMIYMRRAMNGVDFDTTQFGLAPDADGFTHDGQVAPEDDGIKHYLTTRRRANFLVPPLTLRAFPHPAGESVDAELSRTDDEFVVRIPSKNPGDVRTESVRFGWYYEVNRGGGAEPTHVSGRRGALTLHFDATETSIDDAPGGPEGDDDIRLRLFAKTKQDGRPVTATANLQSVEAATETGSPGSEGSGDDERGNGQGKGPKGKPKGKGR